MARVRSSNNGATVGMVAFGIASFLFLLLSIILFSQIGKAQQERDDAEAALAAVVSPAESGNALLAEIQGGEGGGTTVGKLIAEIERLRLGNQSLNAELGGAQTRVSGLESQLNAQTEAARTAQAAQAASETAKVDLEAALRDEVDGLNAKVEAVSAENARLNELIDDQIASLGGSSERLFAEKQGQLDQLAADLASANEQNENLKDTIDQLRGDVVQSPAVTLPDARVVAQNPDENKVFLDIGRNQGLRLGMAFNVFDQDDLVKISDADAQGKGIVEIINVSDDTSIGRVSRLDRQQRVNDGDVLVNVVYDPNRTFSFFVFGQYDLDYDGEVGLRDDQTVRAIVTRSGGELADTLSFDTDYLVLGVEPEFPERPADELDLIQMREFRVQMENFQNYQDVLGQAQQLGIPVLNQSRFLDLVGYFER